MIDNKPLDAKELFGRPVPKWTEPAKVTVELPKAPEPAKPDTGKSDEGGLVAGTEHDNIYALMPDGKVRFVWNTSVMTYIKISAICQYGDELYWVENSYGGPSYISRVMKISEKHLPRTGPSAEVADEHPKMTVNALCDFEGGLFGGGSNGLYVVKYGGTSANAQPWPYTSICKNVNTVCAHDNKGTDLLLSGGEDGIWTAERDIKLTDDAPTAMCSVKGKLYYNNKKVGGRDINIIKGNRKWSCKATRHYPVAAMCTNGEQVYDGGAYGTPGKEFGAVFSTLNDLLGKEPLWKLDKPVTALAYVHGKLWNAMVDK
jgi:hypothetical protein